jgi:hypothetical protein
VTQPRDVAVADAHQRARRNAAGVGAAYIGPPEPGSARDCWAGVVAISDRQEVIETVVVAPDVLPGATFDAGALAFLVEQALLERIGFGALRDGDVQVVLGRERDGMYAVFPTA